MGNGQRPLNKKESNMSVIADSARAGGLAAALVAATISLAGADDRLFDAGKPLEIADQGVFSVPGRYEKIGDHTVMVGQMFVQYQIPKNRTHPYPIVMIHGGGQSGSNFTGTPDGRQGWAQYFLKQGYAVYVVDQAGRGRSALASVYGKTAISPVATIEQRFTA